MTAENFESAICRCPLCGAENLVESAFCRQCTQPLRGGSENQSTLHLSRAVPGPKPSLCRSVTLDQLFAAKQKIQIGRAPICDLVLAHPLVSRIHAQFERTPDGQLRLSDLDSVNGITVGGRRLPSRGSVLLKEAEQVGIGPFLLTFAGQAVHTLDNSQGLRLQAQALEKVIQLGGGKTRKLLDNISLVIEPGEFVSLLGPSGSGKSTLMDCLNGRRRATGGRVLANGADFYGHFDNFRQSLGYVPQKDIVHTQLTVARALYYTAQLRLPTDTTSSELAARVEEVLNFMELTAHRDTLVGDLSGGQIKRVSLGAELLARPSLLFIDEATSGLDAGTEARMMNLFRQLADEGKSLICITHNIDHVDRCHLIIVLARGKLMYYGPPAEACPYFHVARISDIYDRLQDREPETWEREFAASSLHKEYIAKRQAIVQESVAAYSQASQMLPSRPNSSINLSASEVLEHKERPFLPRSNRTPYWHQFRVLTLRYIELIWMDRRSLRLTLLQAPLIALFLLAGFVGKPFQQKIQVPAVSDEEHHVLKLIQAIERAQAENPPDDKRLPVEDLKLWVFSDDIPLGIRTTPTEVLEAVIDLRTADSPC